MNFASGYKVLSFPPSCSGVIRSFLGVGYEFAAEMTYPLPESISAGLVNAMAMVRLIHSCATLCWTILTPSRIHLPLFFLVVGNRDDRGHWLHGRC